MGVKYKESLLPSCIGMHPKKKAKVNIQTATLKGFGRALEDPKAECVWRVGHGIFSTRISFEYEGSPWHRREAKPRWSPGVFQLCCSVAQSLLLVLILHLCLKRGAQTSCKYGGANRDPRWGQKYEAAVGQIWKGADGCYRGGERRENASRLRQFWIPAY